MARASSKVLREMFMNNRFSGKHDVMRAKTSTLFEVASRKIFLTNGQAAKDVVV
jgi:hypothetical protein